jgi:UDP:flavonoid glycosyltransferase YjiC (YdhE family)
MAENAARVDWAGLGTRLAPRFCTPWGIRLAVTRTLAALELRERTTAVAGWSAAHPAGPAAAIELERWSAQS